MTLLKKGLLLFGVDGAIGFNLISRVVSASGALIVVTLISLFLTKEEQGYYYTFGSIVALQIFLELGLSGIITQYVAHEVVHLQLNKEKTGYNGDEKYLSRLSSILHFSLKVFGTLAIILFILLVISGFVFFSRYHSAGSTISWKIPWVILSLSTALMLVVNPLMSFFEGLGKVKEVAQIRLAQQSFNLITLASILFFKGKLYALGCSAFLSFSVLLFSIVFSYRLQLLKNIYSYLGKLRVNYWTEIFPYQWKVALSWVSGYFIFQLFNPVLFATEGPKVAGQMGMVLQVLNGITSISMSWINTKVPLFSSLIAQKNYSKLDSIFNKTVFQLSGVNLLGLLVLISGIIVLNFMNLPFAQRFLPPFYVVLLAVVTFANQFVFSWATYLRCHKEEPFLVNSILVGVLCGLSTFLLGNYCGLNGVVYGYFMISLFIGFPFAYVIFKNKKNEWHKEILI